MTFKKSFVKPGESFGECLERMAKKKCFKAKFNGRRVGAIGITYECESICVGDNEEDARENLYEYFENISNLKLTEVNYDTP